MEARPSPQPLPPHPTLPHPTPPYPTIRLRAQSGRPPPTFPGWAPEEAPGGCTYDPPCRWLEAADLQAGAPATLASGTRLQLAGVPEGVLRRPGLRHFYCCSGCGKVFWEGSHLCRVTSQFSQILSSASSSWKQS